MARKVAVTAPGGGTHEHTIADVPHAMYNHADALSLENPPTNLDLLYWDDGLGSYKNASAAELGLTGGTQTNKFAFFMGGI